MTETPYVSVILDTSFLPSCSFAITTVNSNNAHKNLGNTILDNNKYSFLRFPQLFLNVFSSALRIDNFVKDVIPTFYKANTANVDILKNSRQNYTYDNINSLFSLLFSSIIKYSRRKYAKSIVKSTTTITNCDNRQTLKTKICGSKQRLFYNYKSEFNNLCVRWIFLILLLNVIATTTTTTTKTTKTTKTTTTTTTTTTTKTTTTTNTLPRFSVQERQIVRTLFLKKFGLESLAKEMDLSEILSKSKKKISKKIPDYVWKLYQNAEQKNCDIIRHYSSLPNENVMLIKRPMSLDQLQLKIRFNLSEAIDRRVALEQVVHSDLRIPRAVLTNCLSDEDLMPMNALSSIIYGNANLYEYKKNTQNASKFIMTKRVDNKMQWLDFDVTNYVTREHDNVEMIEFIVELIPSLPINKTKIKKCQKLNNDQTSGLIIFIEHIDEITKFNLNKDNIGTISNTRQKRNAPKLHKKHKHRKHSTPKSNNECRRTELYVDFSELNWQDWIMAPGYEAFQCHGRCPHPVSSYFNATNHAIIQSLINSINPSTVPQPSCVPVEMSAISILYRDINNVVVVKTYPDMIVEACGCH